MMRKSNMVRVLGAVSAIAVLVTGMAGTCPNNNLNPGNGPLAGLSVVLSGLNVSATGDIRVDNNVIAVGTGQNGGIQYIIPAQGNTVQDVTNVKTLVFTGFEIANGWIVARDFDGNILFHNTANGATVDADPTVLKHLSGAASQREFWADNNFVVTVADHNNVTDGHKIKFVDFSGATPQITAFTSDIPDQQGSTQETVICAIDADRLEVLVLQTDVFYRYDMSDPDAAPEMFNMAPHGGVTNATQFFFDDGKVIYHARTTTNDNRRLTYLADLDGGITTQLAENPSGEWDVHLLSGVFGYFAQQVNSDVITNSATRSVWGTVNGAIELTETHETDVTIGANDREDGLVGYGLTLCSTKNGRYRFLAGGGTPSVAEYLQVSKDGSAFTPFPALDVHRNIDPDGILASEIVTSNKICAFRTLTNNQMAYMLLPEN